MAKMLTASPGKSASRAGRASRRTPSHRAATDGACHGLFAPARTPQAIVRKLNAETVRVLQSPGLREKLAALGVEPMVMTSDEFTAHVGREIALNASLAEKAGLKAE
jgi:tripartite-type tricarboxylate transporter receptor subunit TctC